MEDKSPEEDPYEPYWHADHDWPHSEPDSNRCWLLLLLLAVLSCCLFLGHC